MSVSRPWLRRRSRCWRARCAGERSRRCDGRRDPLFCTRTGRRLSRNAVAQRLSIHVQAAARACPSLLGKSIHPHVLRHCCAVSLPQAGVDTTVIALWLGHAGVRSTDAYVHADMTIKEQALP
ncbi:tyrosine-type recombinase/integrase [Streptomyces sp. NPDC059215]|uniref:tyrosine-type recombinase/integrase n=1 Tax=Streptomyces sp. NPDC059215 TaxID=3346772 RepID=UPI00368CCBAF